jgi:hypothetical protein
MQARSRACHGKAEETVAAWAGQVLSMTPMVIFFETWSTGMIRI